MRIVEPWIKVEKIDGKKIMKRLERACRTCYRSEFINPSYIEDKEIYEVWKNTMQEIEKNYIIMKELGASTDMVREVLPHSTAAEYTMTANIREWKHILSLRTTNHVHPAIRQVLIPLLLYFKEEMPEIFGDVEYDTEFDKKYYAKLTVEDEV